MFCRSPSSGNAKIPHMNPAKIPLTLYVHLPWCVRKCPYCDFNSHAARGELPESQYVDALLRDLAADVSLVGDRTVNSIFFGGGTPSLFSPEAIARLLEGFKQSVRLTADCEITLEANPGTVELARFRGFRSAGVNRLSIGIQSFDDAKLRALGRIHGKTEALAAADAARAAGFDNFNLDLMFGLPDQSVDEALADVTTALEREPSHLSLYQLTIEPNTLFHARPPVLPEDRHIDDMQETFLPRLREKGFEPYEVSAFARANRQCRHNLNYWEFGDYLGIGAGAHAKISTAAGVRRFSKPRHPDAFMATAGTPSARTSERAVAGNELAFEFLLNALRLHAGFEKNLFTERTGLPVGAIDAPLSVGVKKGLLEDSGTRIKATAHGLKFLNDTLLLFLPEPQATPVT